jgi:putative holliday junction resolvase
MPLTPDAVILALDIGQARIGVAIASMAARLPRPLTTLANDDQFITNLKQIISDELITQLVVGWPRGLDGQTTQQTQSVETFAAGLRDQIGLPLAFQDEAVTSAQAEAELQARGKMYQKGDVDALAATYILEDYLNQQETTQ